ncbi:phosphate ABC transporter permease subunit PstC [filamentous cyanobacterium LEGE 11480]|uniref:Phosphate transport system permease protein n=1 Tax=Romeriopsis navalis LEGE 11480 TaxID=2777977 RepID=A0A928VJ31_9CYAN|nr:phosphate ABC transporter permease subunit PstC [Romeriopsis navalis]MBE9029548.1 phosphate ABC transporter permease subunit PstC [Romeriopsis navalis LEGE 11480]
MALSEPIARNIPVADEDSIYQAQGFSLPIDRIFKGISLAISLGVVGLLFWLTWVIFNQARPAIAQYGFGFLSSSEWDADSEIFGALPYVYGTLVSSLLALSMAVPVGLSAAVVTSEDFLPKSIQAPIVFLIELIASIPSVIVGFWGIFVLVPFLEPVQLGLYKTLGWIPFFSTETPGFSMFVAAVVLAVMILPTIASISRDVIQAVPRDIRSASIALGATRWEMILTVLLPSSISGIVGAVMLALGRALGETMAVTMVIGNSDRLNISLFDAANTIPAMLANEFGEAFGDLHVGALMYLALVLFLLTLAVNVAAVYLVQALSFKAQ